MRAYLRLTLGIAALATATGMHNRQTGWSKARAAEKKANEALEDARERGVSRDEWWELDQAAQALTNARDALEDPYGPDDPQEYGTPV